MANLGNRNQIPADVAAAARDRAEERGTPAWEGLSTSGAKTRYWKTTPTKRWSRNKSMTAATLLGAAKKPEKEGANNVVASTNRKT